MAGKPLPKGPIDLRQWWGPALRIARQRIGHRAWLRRHEDDLVNFALEKLQRQASQEDVRNPEGFLSVVIHRKIIDMSISHDAEAERLALLVDELGPLLELGKDGELRELVRRQSLRGLSADVIAEEERRLTRLRAAASIAVMPDEESQLILADRFYDDSLADISALARRHKKSPNVMSNYLAKVIGSHSDPGAIGVVSEVLRSLQLRTAEAFVRILVDLDNLDVVTDPFAGAISYLELIGARSPDHKKVAVTAIARLRWLERNFPNNRGIGNKILRRLVTAGCLYVMEENDAVHDFYDVRGLTDDLSLLTALFEVVRNHSN